MIFSEKIKTVDNKIEHIKAQLHLGRHRKNCYNQKISIFAIM